MKTLSAAALAIVGLWIAPAIGAEGVDCASYQLVDAGGAAYVAIDEVAGEKYLISAWVYAESNGEPGLQRGGSTLLLGEQDICQNSSNPDTGIL